VVWAAGEESTADETFSAEQQAAIRAYLAADGTLWASGAELLWDLDERGSAEDRAFAAAVLGAALESDDAGTTTALGEGLLGGLDLGFGNAYPVEWPDVLASDREVAARYATGGVAAVMGNGVATFGFPFDTIASDEVRGEVADRVLAYLVPDYSPPTDDADLDDSGGSAAPSEPSGCGCGHAEPPGITALLLALATHWRRAQAARCGRGPTLVPERATNRRERDVQMSVVVDQRGKPIPGIERLGFIVQR
jgi:MYXO-CTERM domain-containing protein